MSDDISFSKVLVFGKLPPPIGGVTTSIKNLVEILSYNNVDFRIFDYRISQLSAICKFYDLSHVNSSSPLKRLISLVLGRILSGKVVFVIHGSRFDPDNIINRICLALTSGVIVLNQRVKNSILKTGFSADKILFQSPILRSFVKRDVSAEFRFLKEKHPDRKVVTIYSNHGGCLDGKEVYGLTFFFSDLIDCFDADRFLFVVVDLDGSYFDTVKSLDGKYKFLYFDRPVDFSALLDFTDFYIRPTNFDGSSIAILEALQCNVIVIASDVVDRPIGVITYQANDKQSFYKALMLSSSIENVGNNPLSDISELFEFYLKI